MFRLGIQTTQCFQNTPEMQGSPRELLGIFMRKESAEQPWLFGLRAWVPHCGEDGHQLSLLEIFWQVKLGTLVMLVTLQSGCKSLTNLHEIEFSSISLP